MNERLRLGPGWLVIALVALGVTWSQNVQWMLANPDASPWQFVTDGFANHAAASLSWDLLLLTTACIAFMVIEARRHAIRFLWAYVLFAFVIAISVTFPLFLWARERAIDRGASAAQDGAKLG